MISGPTQPRRIISLGNHGRNEGKNRTKWDFELRRELNRLVNLNYAIRRGIVQEALKMEDENGWKRLDLHLLARPARAGLANLHGLELREVCRSERVLNGVY